MVENMIDMNTSTRNNAHVRRYLYYKLWTIFPSVIILLISTLLLSYIFLMSYLKMSSPTKIDIVPNSRINLGEGPYWDIEKQSLYYVDIYDATVYRYDYNSRQIYKCKIDGETQVSFILPVQSSTNKDEFVISAGRKVGIIKWDGKSNKTKIERVLFEVENDKINNRFNDGKCDPNGRLIAGTMRLEILKGDIFSYHEGNLYCYTPENGVRTIKTNVGISNGLDWNVNLKKMYYIDSVDMNVVQYDYDHETGDINLQSKKEIMHFEGKPDIVPDGMTVDIRGYLYVVLHGKGKIVVIDPKNSKIIQEISFPSKLITSCAFGGPNLDLLFVTSAHKGVENPPAGSLYILHTNTKGLPMTKCRVK